jgi:hypothetical protein
MKKSTAKVTTTVDAVATVKQFRAVVFKMSKIVQNAKGIEDKFWFRLWKQVEAVLARHNPEGVTKAQVTAWFKTDKLPDYLIGNLNLVELVDLKSKPAQDWSKKKTGVQPKAEKITTKDKAKAKGKALVPVTKPKASKPAPKASKPAPKASKPAPKAVIESNKTQEAFEARLTFLEGEVSNMSESIETIKSGMEMILEAIRR